MLEARWSIRSGRTWAAAVLLSALIAVLAAILVLRADTQGAVARWSRGRDIHVYLQPEVTASEAHTLRDEVASANGVRSVRVAALPGWVEVRQEVFFSGYSLLPCCTRQISTPGYLDVVATSPSQVNHVEADVQGWEGVLAVTDSSSGTGEARQLWEMARLRRRRLLDDHGCHGRPYPSATAVAGSRAAHLIPSFRGRHRCEL